MHSYIVVCIHINSQYVSSSCASSTQRSHSAYNKHFQDIQALYALPPKKESEIIDFAVCVTKTYKLEDALS